ncbi:hypothetical protein PanWU01x14_101270 [Parasponia andersonii]|uniref:Uncharacterized protein n=1 Tax=Parasponia andersonii TaxID=3476 RepID=A0A2P5D338_PARAD|nr:hypothetical protein PanWU01x14_101270 [Parasponia andersonii]
MLLIQLRNLPILKLLVPGVRKLWPYFIQRISSLRRIKMHSSLSSYIDGTQKIVLSQLFRK